MSAVAITAANRIAEALGLERVIRLRIAVDYDSTDPPTVSAEMLLTDEQADEVATILQEFELVPKEPTE